VPRFVAAILAGPGPAEAARVVDLLASLDALEPRAAGVCVVDDEPGGPRSWPTGVTAVLPNPRAGRGIGTLGGTCAGTLTALAWAAREHPGAWVLRLDSDALVVGPVAERVETAFAEHPGAGVLGCCHRTPNGQERVHPWWGPVVRKHARAVWLWRRPPLPRRHVTPAVPVVRRTVRAALAAGYRPGEHCIAAGCAIAAPFVAALQRDGQLDDPLAWLPTLFGDDVMLGAQARALGFDLVDVHGVFGIQHQGLPDAPQALLDRGFGVVHSLKNDPRVTEDEARAFFARARGEGGAA
jgi:hypothetical protein